MQKSDKFKEINNNNYQKNRIDNYIHGQVFKERCEELNRLIKESEEKKKRNRVKLAELQQSETLNLFNNNECKSNKTQQNSNLQIGN